MNVFGLKFGSKKGEGPSPAEAIAKLRDCENILMKKQEYLEEKIEKELKTAKLNASTNKRVARQAIMKKKKYEKQLNQVDCTLATLEVQRESLGDAIANSSVLEVMKSASDALKKVHKNYDTDKINDIIDDIAEQIDLSKDISVSISSPMFGNEMDDDELAQELEKFAKIQKPSLKPTNSEKDLPEVPREKVSEKEKADSMMA